jgi:hypothetical protein
MKYEIYDALDIHSEHGIAAAFEAKRIADKYQKDYLDCDDLAHIMSVGKNNIRRLMNSSDFPTVEIGNRKVVSVLAFSLWSLSGNKTWP